MSTIESGSIAMRFLLALNSSKHLKLSIPDGRETIKLSFIDRLNSFVIYDGAEEESEQCASERETHNQGHSLSEPF